MTTNTTHPMHTPAPTRRRTADCDLRETPDGEFWVTRRSSSFVIEERVPPTVLVGLFEAAVAS